MRTEQEIRAMIEETKERAYKEYQRRNNGEMSAQEYLAVSAYFIGIQIGLEKALGE